MDGCTKGLEASLAALRRVPFGELELLPERRAGVPGISRGCCLADLLPLLPMVKHDIFLKACAARCAVWDRARVDMGLDTLAASIPGTYV